MAKVFPCFPRWTSAHNTQENMCFFLVVPSAYTWSGCPIKQIHKEWHVELGILTNNMEVEAGDLKIGCAL